VALLYQGKVSSVAIRLINENSNEYTLVDISWYHRAPSVLSFDHKKIRLVRKRTLSQYCIKKKLSLLLVDKISGTLNMLAREIFFCYAAFKNNPATTGHIHGAII